VVSFESTGGSSSTIQVSESAGTLQVVLVLSKAVDQPANVTVVSTGITATGLFSLSNISSILITYSHLVDVDFGPPQNYTVNFPAGSTRGSVDIPITNDDLYELDETFQLEISVPEAAVRAGVIVGCDPFTPSLNVEIIDDDGKLQIYTINTKVLIVV